MDEVMLKAFKITLAVLAAITLFSITVTVVWIALVNVFRLLTEGVTSVYPSPPTSISWVGLVFFGLMVAAFAYAFAWISVKVYRLIRTKPQ